MFIECVITLNNEGIQYGEKKTKPQKIHFQKYRKANIQNILQTAAIQHKYKGCQRKGL